MIIDLTRGDAYSTGERGVGIDPDIDLQAILLRVKHSRLDVPTEIFQEMELAGCSASAIA